MEISKQVLLILFTMQYMLPYLTSCYIAPIVLSPFILITYFEFQILSGYVCKSFNVCFIVQVIFIKCELMWVSKWNTGCQVVLKYEPIYVQENLHEQMICSVNACSKNVVLLTQQFDTSDMCARGITFAQWLFRMKVVQVEQKSEKSK